MSHTVETIYIGSLRTKATHIKSGQNIITDAPTDNQGKGEYFSPTDLATASLTSCMMTIIGIMAERHKFNIDGLKAKTTKVMSSDSPRRIAQIQIDFEFPHSNYSDKEKTIIQASVKGCPVALSLHPDIKVIVNYKF